MPRRLGFCVVLFAYLCCFLTAGAQGNQTAQITLGQSAVPLCGPWKFTVGDSPVDPQTGKLLWAEPGFDDSTWEAVDLTPDASGYMPGWGGKGHAGYSGYGWYRIRVRIHALPGDGLALAGPGNFDDAYQVFLDGTLLGGFGFRGQEPKVYFALPIVFPFTETSDANQKSDQRDETQVIAFRFWVSRATLAQQADAGGFHNSPLIGTSEAVSAIHQLAWLEVARQNAVTVLLGIVFAVLFATAFALFLNHRTDYAYLWMSIGCLLATLVNLEFALAAMAQTFSATTDFWFGNAFVLPMLRFAWLMMLRSWFRMERPRWMPWLAAVLTLLSFVIVAGSLGLIPFVAPVFVPVFFVLSQLIYVVFLVLFCWVAFHGVRKHGIEGWLLVPMPVVIWVNWLSARLPFLHLSRLYSPFGIAINTLQIQAFLLTAVICALLTWRWMRSVREQRRLAFDMKQAQEVQRVILPESRVQLQGLAIESEYRPAREVGGDFFQIIPHLSDGSVLIVAGDVAGKGLQAGMLVALLIGAARTAAQYDADPLAVLNTLNQRLVGRGEAAATCLALRIDLDGSATLANAGHMAPYRNGEPLAMAGALPLGMIAGAEFSVMRFRLELGDRLILMSDGIVEAMDEQGQLFGFERIEQLLLSSRTSDATTLADAAQKFGQEDDISVISVERTAVLAAANSQPVGTFG